MGNALRRGSVAEVQVDHRRFRYTQEQKDQVLRLVDSGLTYRQVAVQISPHLSPGTISRWVTERNQGLEAARLEQEYNDYIRQGETL